jgi:hypothetical protein
MLVQVFGFDALHAIERSAVQGLLAIKMGGSYNFIRSFAHWQTGGCPEPFTHRCHEQI